MTEDLWREFRTDDSDTSDISNRDRALFLLQNFDLEGQLLAIRNVIRRNSQDDRDLSAEIKNLDARIRSSALPYAERLQDLWLERLHTSVFQDAAHSMSAVGMLAPFVESLFVALFSGLRHYHQLKEGITSERTVCFAPDEFWRTHFPFSRHGRRSGIVGEITEVSDSIGLATYLPTGYASTLSALFAYRNKMFHHGFEWPVEERYKFEETMRNKGWSLDWFEKSTSGDVPWIFYMSDEFIDHCLKIIDQILEGVGMYLTQHDEDWK